MATNEREHGREPRGADPDPGGGYCFFCEEALEGICKVRGLTARQGDYAQAVFLCDSEKEIAELLGVTTPTVKKQIARLKRKLGAGSRVPLSAEIFRAHQDWFAMAGPPEGCRLRDHLRRLTDPQQ